MGKEGSLIHEEGVKEALNQVKSVQWHIAFRNQLVQIKEKKKEEYKVVEKAETILEKRIR